MEGKPKQWQSQLSIAILNYHEVTKDARVFKQARALADAGHKVNVYCNHLEGMPAVEILHKVHIKRFRCFDRKELDSNILERLFFLNRSRQELVTRLEYYSTIEATVRKLELGYELLSASKFPDRRYYKNATGLRRWVRKLEYRYIKKRGHKYLERAGSNAASVPFTELSSYLKDRRARIWRHLEPMRSLVFLDNFLSACGAEHVDIVHAHDMMTLPAGAIFAKQHNARLIYDAHEYEPERVSLSPQERAFTEKFESDCLDEVDAIVTVSKGIAQLYAARFDGDEPTLIYNSPDIRQAESGTGTKRLRERLSLPSKAPLVVFIGAIQRANRGVDKIVEALVHLPEYHLVNLGPRHKANDNWLRDIAKELGVEDRLHFLAPVPAQDVPYVVSDASVAASASQNLCLSYLHSMPNKLFEATFAGIPVCVPDRPDQKEFVSLLGHGVAMDQTDSQAIAEAMREVVENTDKYRLSEQAEALLRNEYSWQAQIGRLLALYEKLAMDKVC